MCNCGNKGRLTYNPQKGTAVLGPTNTRAPTAQTTPQRPARIVLGQRPNVRGVLRSIPRQVAPQTRKVATVQLR